MIGPTLSHEGREIVFGKTPIRKLGAQTDFLSSIPMAEWNDVEAKKRTICTAEDEGN